MWAGLAVIAVAGVLILPPLIAVLSLVYFSFRFRTKQKAWLLPRGRRATLEERMQSFNAYEKWQRQSWGWEHRRYMCSIGILKAWGFLLGASLLWNAFNGFFIAYFQEYGRFPLVVAIAGFVVFLLMAVVWWVVEFTYD